MVWGGRVSRSSVLVRTVAVTVLITMAWPSCAEAPPAAGCNEHALQLTQIRSFFDAATSAKQPDICERANDPVVRNHCLALYAEHTLDTRPCWRIAAGAHETQVLRDACLSGVAIARRDPGLCKPISIPVIRDSCFMTLVVQFGADRGNCEQIENPVLKSSCKE